MWSISPYSISEYNLLSLSLYSPSQDALQCPIRTVNFLGVFKILFFFVLFIFILVLQLTKSMQINDDEKKTYLNCIKCSRSDQSGISVILESRIRCLCLKHPWTIIIPFSPRDYLEIHGPSKMTESWWPHFFIKLALIQVITQRTFLNFDQKRSKQRVGSTSPSRWQ